MMTLHFLLCVTLAWTIFCRAVKMNKATRTDVRAGLVLLGTVALLGLALPVLRPQWCPDVYMLALEAAMAAVQIVTSRHWRDGPPHSYQKGDS